MRYLFLCIVILSILTSGCNGYGYKISDKSISLTTMNTIIKDSISQQISSLQHISLDIKGVINSTNDSAKQIYYLGKISTAPQQVKDFTYIEQLEVRDGEKTSGMTISIAKTMSKAKDVVTKLELFANKSSNISDRDLQILSAIAEKLDLFSSEINQILEDQQFSLVNDYDLSPSDKILNEMDQLLSTVD